MRILKKLICTLVISSMVFLSIGCGDSNKLIDKPADKPIVVPKDIKEIKIGLLNCMTGDYKDSGGLDGYRGQIIAIDMVNDKGGINGKIKVNVVECDTESKTDVAVRQVEKLVNDEKVPVIAGIYNSSIAEKVAAACEKNKTIFWDHIAVSDQVLVDKHYNYVFRPVIMGNDRGRGAVDFIKGRCELFGAPNPSDLKVAIIYEDGPFGTSTLDGIVENVSKYNMKLVLKESYSKTVKSLKDLVGRLVEVKPDVIFHTSYYKDMLVFIKDAKEQGLKAKTIVGLGGGYGRMEEVAEAIGDNTVCQGMIVFDNPMVQLIKKDRLSPGLFEQNEEFLRRMKEKFKVDKPNNYYSASFAHTMILLNEVIPAALKNYGDITAETIKKACMDLNIPERNTNVGYGVKFAPPDHKYAGQNVMAYNFALQWNKDKWSVVWPKSFETASPIPLPSDSPFSVFQRKNLAPGEGYLRELAFAQEGQVSWDPNTGTATIVANNITKQYDVKTCKLRNDYIVVNVDDFKKDFQIKE